MCNLQWLLVLGAFLLAGFCPRQADAQALAPSPANAPTPTPFLPASSPPPPIFNETGGQKLTFCVANYSPVPIAMCSNGTATTPANFSGHDVDMLRIAAGRLGLTEGVDYSFKCTSFSTLVDSLTQPSGPCSLAASAITITTERQAKGIQFTYPYMRSSLGILVASNSQSGDGWGFIRPFNWTLWLALFLTLLAFPPLIFMIEFFSLRRRIHRKDWRPGIAESMWRTALNLMLYDIVNVTSLGARMAVLTFCFLALLTTSTYTANLAAFVTIKSLQTRINTVDRRNDLRGKAVGTSPIYVARLRKYGIQAIPFPFDNGEDYVQWGELVATGQLASMVRDMAPLLWLANSAPLCEITVLPQEIEPFDYGVAFAKNMSSTFVEEWSSIILQMQEDGTLQQLKSSYIFNPEAGCQLRNQMSQETSSVTFGDLWGLWLIAGVGAAVGICIMLAQRTLRRVKNRRGKPVSHKAPMPEGGRQAPRTPLVGRLMTRKLRKNAYSSRREKPAAGAAEDDVKPPGWDVESQADGATPPDLSAGRTVPPVATEVQQAQQTPELSHGAGLSDDITRRPSALQVVDSIYAGIHWKSSLRDKKG